MAVLSHNDCVARMANGYSLMCQPIWDEVGGTSTLANSVTVQRIGNSKAMPSVLPNGVTGFIPTRFSMAAAQAGVFGIGKFIQLGIIDMSAGAGSTPTGRNNMPTQTVGNTSYDMQSPVFMEVTTVLTGAAPTLTLVYKRSSGDGNQTSAAQTVAATAAINSGGFFKLNTGDSGVYNIQTYTPNAAQTGIIKLWGFIPFSMVNIESANVSNSMPLLFGGSFSLVKLGASDQVSGLMYINNTAKGILGTIDFLGDS